MTEPSFQPPDPSSLAFPGALLAHRLATEYAALRHLANEVDQFMKHAGCIADAACEQTVFIAAAIDYWKKVRL